MPGVVQKLRIGVFLGGKSIEREVSFNSGRTVCDHLDTHMYDVFPIYQTYRGDLYILPWSFLHRGKTSDFGKRLDEAEKIEWDDLPNMIDFAYIAMHGQYAEDGTLQGMLEVLGVPYLGCKVFSSALSMNKAWQKAILDAQGIPTPRGIVISAYHVREFATRAPLPSQRKALYERISAASLTYPLIVKPVCEGSSLGIRVIFSKSELCEAIIFAGSCNDVCFQDVLVEEKVEGMEFVGIALENFDSGVSVWDVLPITEIEIEKETHFFDYEQKYMPGRASKITPARCSKKDEQRIRDMCLRVTQTADFKTVLRIDGFLKKSGDIVILDVQPITGMGPATFLFHQAAEVGMSHTRLINKLIETDLMRLGLLQSKVLGMKSMRQKKQHKKRIAVLCGGDSQEREISLESGRNVSYKLSPYEYEVIPLFVAPDMKLYTLSERMLIQNSTSDILRQMSDKKSVKWSDLPMLCDFVFIGLHGGRGEDGSVQGTLEMLGLPYNGSGVLTSALCIDKYKANEFLRHKGFDTPLAVLLTRDLWQRGKRSVLAHIACVSLPAVVKPHNDGCSMLVSKVSSQDALLDALDAFFETDRDSVMVEEYVEGMELTVGVYGNETITVLPPSKPVVQEAILSLEEKFLPGAGENQTPAPLSRAESAFVSQILAQVAQELSISGYARIDCFFQNAHQSPTGEQRLVILEVNTLPALTPATCIFHQAAEIGMRPMDFIDTIIKLGFDRHKVMRITKPEMRADNVEEKC